MQKIASLAHKLDMTAEEAVETLRYMLFDVESIESEISDEACDLLIEVEEDPTVKDRVRNGKLKEREKAEETERKAEGKRKAVAQGHRGAPTIASASRGLNCAGPGSD